MWISNFDQELHTVIFCILGIWKSRLGSGATYRALTEVFFKAGRLDCADAVCGILKPITSTLRGKQGGLESWRPVITSLNLGVQLC